jgi:hypothetical protein
MFLVMGASNLSSQIALIFQTDVTRETATYSCPWVKTALLRSNPTCFTDCPWDLLIDIAKETLTGNCRLQNSKGTWVEDGIIGLFTVAILGPFLAHFQTHFRLIFVYLAEKQTKGNEKWCKKWCEKWLPWTLRKGNLRKMEQKCIFPSRHTAKKMNNDHFLGPFLQQQG